MVRGHTWLERRSTPGATCYNQRLDQLIVVNAKELNVATTGDLDALQMEIDALIAASDGTIGVAIHDLTSGAEVLVNPDEPFPTASVMKTPILAALYARAERGEIDLNERIEFTARMMVPGSGVLQDLAFGLQPTVKDLATLMITVSDNAATDMVLDLLGLDTLEAALGEFGLTRTKIPMTVRELLYTMVGLDISDPAHTYELFQARSRAGTIDWQGKALSDQQSNISTPREMNQLLAKIERREIVSPAACEAMLDILKRQKYNDIIPRYLPAGTPVAHKTGSLRGVRNDAGIIYAPSGPIVISLFAKRLGDQVAGSDTLARIARATWETFAGPIPPSRYGPVAAEA